MTATKRDYGYSRTNTNVLWRGIRNGIAYGVSSTDTWVKTADGYTITDTSISALYGSKPVSDLHADEFGFVVHTAGALDSNDIPSGTGAVWVGETLNNLVDVTPSSWVTDTCGRNGILARNSNGVLLVGAYGYWASDGNATIWRSTDSGQSWTSWNPGGATRHIHAVNFDPSDPTIAWATLGDSVGSPRGLYKSTDSGSTWSLVASSEYPIDFDFLNDGTFVGEGDGINRPHIVTWVPANGTTFVSAITPAMAESATGQANWQGTTRALSILGPDSIFYTTTAEEGATGTRWGIWKAVRSGGTWTPELLEELTARWMTVGGTYQLSPHLLLSNRYRIVVP